MNYFNIVSCANVTKLDVPFKYSIYMGYGTAAKNVFYISR
jgi:hypothetical protein